jgi:hypothetical protein
MVLRMNNKFSAKTKNNKLILIRLAIVAGIWVLAAGIMGAWFYSQWQDLKSGKLSKIEAKNLASKSESDGVEAINTSASSDEPSKGYMLRNWTQLIQAGNYVCDSANDFKYLGKSNIGMEFRVNCDEYVHNYKVVIRPNKEVYVVSE